MSNTSNPFHPLFVACLIQLHATHANGGDMSEIDPPRIVPASRIGTHGSMIET